MMTRILALTAISSLALAGTAHAGDMNTSKAMKQTAPATTVLASDARIVVIDNQPIAVLGVVERNGETLYSVAAPDGDVFVNHVPNDLTEVTTDVDLLDTYTYEYRGVTYENRVVRDDAPSVG